jgi:hypothetical protein
MDGMDGMSDGMTDLQLLMFDFNMYELYNSFVYLRFPMELRKN